MQKIVLLMLLMSISCVNADDGIVGRALTIDQPISEGMRLQFENDDELTPKSSEFKILSSLLLSNEIGERWATITLENMSAQQRLLDNEHIVAVFADGDKRYPLNADQKFSGHEVITLILNFGVSKFPILKVYNRNE